VLNFALPIYFVTELAQIQLIMMQILQVVEVAALYKKVSQQQPAKFKGHLEKASRNQHIVVASHKDLLEGLDSFQKVKEVEFMLNLAKKHHYFMGCYFIVARG
jgi:hypothetical protein